MQYILYKYKIYFTFLEICESRGRTPPKRDVAENIQKGARRFVREEKNLRMKVARTRRGLSQSDLAEAVGATRQTIGLIEAGRYNPSLKLCVAICKTLGVTLNDLFWDDDAS